MLPTKKSQNWLPGIFNDFFGNEWMEKSNSAAPAINILETDKEYKVELAAPGLTKDDFNKLRRQILLNAVTLSDSLSTDASAKVLFAMGVKDCRSVFPKELLGLQGDAPSS